MNNTWHIWADRKQTYQEIADDNFKNRYWVQKKLDKFEEVNYGLTWLKPQDTCLCIDTTHFGDLSLMVFRSPDLKSSLYAKVVTRETIEEYKSGIEVILKAGFNIKAIISDGKGLGVNFFDIPMQMCHFHQLKIITKYLTKNPILEANIELRKLALSLPRTDKESFIGNLNNWHKKWGEFLKEKTINEETGRWVYTHKRTRSAYFSLKRNLPYLFTFYDYPELNIPNTNNSLEGYFSSLKNKANFHKGLRKDRKIKLIFYLLFREKQPPKNAH